MSIQYVQLGGRCQRKRQQAVNEIFEAAKARKELKGDSVTYEDYEEFKKALHDLGVYGCERQLANILYI